MVNQQKGWMMTADRLSTAILEDLDTFVLENAKAWMASGRIKRNSFGVEILVAPLPGNDFGDAKRYYFGNTADDAIHDSAWYRENAGGKNDICLETGLDSLVAVRLYPGLIRQIDGAFPWGGAIIDAVYGLIIGTSGFKEDEDILFSQTIRNYLVMLLNREGEVAVASARERGEQTGAAGANRFISL